MERAVQQVEQNLVATTVSNLSFVSFPWPAVFTKTRWSVPVFFSFFSPTHCFHQKLGIHCLSAISTKTWWSLPVCFFHSPDPPFPPKLGGHFPSVHERFQVASHTSSLSETDNVLHETPKIGQHVCLPSWNIATEWKAVGFWTKSSKQIHVMLIAKCILGVLYTF